MSLIRRRDVLKSAAVLGIGLPALTSARSAEAKEIPELSNASQLFVDLDRVENLENVKHDFHAAEKHPANPVLRKERPWEEFYRVVGSVIFDSDENIFKAWYLGQGRSTGVNQKGRQTYRHTLCYATSRDGVRWDRPELGLHDFAGSKKNNIVIPDDYHDGQDHWESVLKDPLDPNPARRYKALGWSSFDPDQSGWCRSRGSCGIYTMTSPDGLRWTHSPEPAFHFRPRPDSDDLGPFGDAHGMMIDTLRKRYVAFLRKLPHRAVSVSKDFVNWTQPESCLRARPGEVNNTIYDSTGFVYGDQYLGYLCYFQRDKRNPLLWVELITSRDGLSWHRVPVKQPLIGMGDVGEFDRFTNMIIGGPPVRVGDRLYLYYRGTAVRHSPYDGTDDTGMRFPGGMGLATLRVDGFASLSASYDGGEVTTKLFRCNGGPLEVNAKADFGRLRAAVLDDNGKPIPGYIDKECQVIQQDGIQLSVRWQDHVNLKALTGRPIRLRFHLENARLFSYRIG
ncbi:MAG: hypothetical protein CMJ78_22570 [Planctomycetaceae bacterium]|nr:hypothetical protein [Planctomycetaceae bacterium]